MYPTNSIKSTNSSKSFFKKSIMCGHPVKRRTKLDQVEDVISSVERTMTIALVGLCCLLRQTEENSLRLWEKSAIVTRRKKRLEMREESHVRVLQCHDISFF